jgi:methylthioribose-1-phosphate isomerase
VQVDFYTDAGVGAALDHTDAVLLGADAVAPRWFLNKVGSAALAAAASSRGTPVYLVAGRDKFVPPQLEAALTIEMHPADEVWDTPPPGVVVRNAYFERVPLDLVTALVTDAGLLTPDMVEEACRANGASLSSSAAELLLAGG